MRALHLKLKRAIRKGDEAAIRQILIAMKYHEMSCVSVCTGKKHKLDRSNLERQGRNPYKYWSGPRQSNSLKGRNGVR